MYIHECVRDFITMEDEEDEEDDDDGDDNRKSGTPTIIPYKTKMLA